MRTLFAALTALIPCVSWAQHHHTGEGVAVDEFYSSWMMPDRPEASCCNERDCYATEVKSENGNWYALRREDRKWLLVPVNKIEHNRDNPDGRNHVCASPPWAGEHVYCFIVGGGY